MHDYGAELRRCGAAALVLGALLPPVAAAEAWNPPLKPPPAGVRKQAESRVDRWGDPLPPGVAARIGTERFVGWGPFVFAPDGARYCCGVGDDAGVFDTATGRLLRRLEGCSGGLSAVAFSPDGARVATIEGNQTLRVWEAARGGLIHQFRRARRLYAAAFSPDGERVAAAGESGAAVWRVEDGALLAELHEPRPTFVAAAFLADGKSMALGGYGVPLCLWNGESELPRGHPIYLAQDPSLDPLPTQFVGEAHGPGLAFSADGRTAALSRGNEEWIEVWKPAARRCVRISAHPEVVRGTALSRDGALLACLDAEGAVRLWDAASGRFLRTFLTEKEIPSDRGLQQLAFSPDGRTLAGTSNRSGDRLRMWDVASGKPRRLVDAPDGEVASVAFAPGASQELWIASPGAEPMFRGWDLRRGDCVRAVRIEHPSPPPPAGSSASARAEFIARRTPRLVRPALASDGRTAAFGDVDGVWLVDLEVGAVPRRLLGASRDGIVKHVEFSRDGRSVAAQDSRCNYLVWNVAEGNLRARFLSDGRAARPDLDGGLAGLSADGAKVVHTLVGAKIRCCDVAPAEPFLYEAQHRTLQSVAFAPDGESFAAADDKGVIHIWSIATRTLRARIDPEPGAGRPRSLLYSPDGRTLAATRFHSVNDFRPEGVVDLYEVAAARRSASLQGGFGGVSSIAFSADGRSLAAGGLHGEALVWALDGRAPRSAFSFGPSDLPVFWEALLRRDLNDVDSLLWRAAAFTQAVSFLRERLKPPAPSPRARTLAAALDDDRFEAREAAEAELAELGGAARETLREFLEGRPSLEARRRAERLLRRDQDPLSPDNFRAARSAAILERSTDPDARRFLAELAALDPSTFLAQEAIAALRRLEAPSPR